MIVTSLPIIEKIELSNYSSAEDLLQRVQDAVDKYGKGKVTLRVYNKFYEYEGGGYPAAELDCARPPTPEEQESYNRYIQSIHDASMARKRADYLKLKAEFETDPT